MIPYVVNRKTPVGLEAETHYIGRPSRYGNPFRLAKYTRAEALERFEVYARASPIMRKLIAELPADAVLGCYCKPLDCHGDVIVKLWREYHATGTIHE